MTVKYFNSDQMPSLILMTKWCNIVNKKYLLPLTLSGRVNLIKYTTVQLKCTYNTKKKYYKNL